MTLFSRCFASALYSNVTDSNGAVSLDVVPVTTTLVYNDPSTSFSLTKTKFSTLQNTAISKSNNYAAVFTPAVTTASFVSQTKLAAAGEIVSTNNKNTNINIVPTTVSSQIVTAYSDDSTTYTSTLYATDVVYVTLLQSSTVPAAALTTVAPVVVPSTVSSEAIITYSDDSTTYTSTVTSTNVVYVTLNDLTASVASNVVPSTVSSEIVTTYSDESTTYTSTITSTNLVYITLTSSVPSNVIPSTVSSEIVTTHSDESTTYTSTITSTNLVYVTLTQNSSDLPVITPPSNINNDDDSDAAIKFQQVAFTETSKSGSIDITTTLTKTLRVTTVDSIQYGIEGSSTVTTLPIITATSVPANENPNNNDANQGNACAGINKVQYITVTPEPVTQTVTEALETIIQYVTVKNSNTFSSTYSNWTNATSVYSSNFNNTTVY